MVNKETKNQKEPLVSIVVPIFNAQEHLARCIESLVKQSYSNLEVILVDDGSIDDSPHIAKKYTKKHKSVKLFNQSNAGVSAARNKGVEASTGDYVTFVDADDWLEIGAIEEMVLLAKEYNADCIRMNANIVRGESRTPIQQNIKEGIYTARDGGLRSLAYASAVGDLLCYVWLLMVKKEVLTTDTLRFPVGISMMEDTMFYSQLLGAINSLYISDKITYNYMTNEDGASRSMHGLSEKIDSIIRVDQYLQRQDGFDLSQKSHISAVNGSIIASMVMVRADKVPVDKIQAMLAIVAGYPATRLMLADADMQKLTLYHRLATWAVLHNNTAAVLGLKAARKVIGK